MSGLRRALLVALPSAAVALWLLGATADHGVGLYPDSVDYVSTAVSLAEGRGFVDHRDRVYTLWPPLYPTVLAAGALAGVDPVVWARWLAILCYVSIVAFAGLWLGRHLRSATLAGMGVALVALGWPLTKFSTAALSEPLFWLLSLLALGSLDGRAGNGGKGTPQRRRPWLAAAFSALALLTRFVGVAVVLVNAGRILAPNRGPLRRRLSDAALYCGLSVAPTALWMLRNWVVTGQSAGQRNPSSLSLLANLEQAATTVGRWFAVFGTPPLVAGALVVAVLAAGAFVRDPGGRRPGGRRPRGRGDDGDPQGPGPMLPWLAFAAVFFVFVVAMRTAFEFNPLRDRLLSPIYVPLVFCLAFSLDRLLHAARSRTPSRRWAAAQALVLLLATLPVLHLASRVWKQGDDLFAKGFADPAWSATPLADWLRRSAPEGIYLSNEPAAAYLFTRQTTLPLPRNQRFSNDEAHGRLAKRIGKLRRVYPSDPLHLVWFEQKIQARRRHLFDEDALVGRLGATPLASFDSGRVYRLPPVGSPTFADGR
ncbi:MAG: hypothetical protein AAGN66_29040 [Acidobacteriota bacterium]